MSSTNFEAVLGALRSLTDTKLSELEATYQRERSWVTELALGSANLLPSPGGKVQESAATIKEDTSNDPDDEIRDKQINPGPVLGCAERQRKCILAVIAVKVASTPH
eukprot:scaffold19034_cov36-Prasinocladus_malaysianus.AAC.1